MLPLRRLIVPALLGSLAIQILTASGSRSMPAPRRIPLLDDLDPRLTPRAYRLVARAARAGIRTVVISGRRSRAEQERLYAQGRTAPGPIVTHAPPGTSKHELGLAFDLAPANAAGLPDWGAPAAVWARLGELGEAEGLRWGGRWTDFPDRPHFELPA